MVSHPSVSLYRHHNLLIRLQEDRGTRGAVQSLETTFLLLSFEAHKPVPSEVTLGSKEADFLLASSPLRSSPGKYGRDKQSEALYEIEC